MMTTRQLQDEILRLKKEKDICILAHAYQSQEILEVADYTGDSYGLSQQAAKAPQKNVLMCGVRFMAETVKILSPEKTVYLSNSGAGCPMAEQLAVEMLSALKASNPDYTVVAYINTTSELKTIRFCLSRIAIWEPGWRSRCLRKHLSLFTADVLPI